MSTGKKIIHNSCNSSLSKNIKFIIPQNVSFGFGSQIIDDNRRVSFS